MSATDQSARTAVSALEELPQFELGYLFDDGESPAEVTVFPKSNDRDISTHWITVDSDHAVALDDIR